MEGISPRLSSVPKGGDKNHAIAQGELGYMYRSGQGGSRTTTRRENVSKGSGTGVRSGQCELGLMYVQGIGVKQDYAAAFEWYRKAAEQGLGWRSPIWVIYTSLGKASRRISNRPYDGTARRPSKVSPLGKLNWATCTSAAPALSRTPPWAPVIPQSGRTEQRHGGVHAGNSVRDGKRRGEGSAEAAKWFQKSAQAGHPKAQYRLGLLYEQGTGVEKDAAKAFEWFTKAAAQGDPDAAKKLGKSPGSNPAASNPAGNNPAGNNPAGNNPAGNNPAGNNPAASNPAGSSNTTGNDSPEALYRQGRAYYEGQGVAKDFNKAAELYRLAAERGHAAGQCDLGAMYERGEGVKQDYAWRWSCTSRPPIKAIRRPRLM